jgi:hypothetical protein
MEKQPRLRPIVRLPESPRKMEAGFILKRKNPSRVPHSKSAPEVNPASFSNNPAKAVAAAIRAPTPDASPSKPSIRLNAFMQATSQKMLREAIRVAQCPLAREKRKPAATAVTATTS